MIASVASIALVALVALVASSRRCGDGVEDGVVGVQGHGYRLLEEIDGDNQTGAAVLVARQAGQGATDDPDSLALGPIR
ncbi:MAG: hypothetical protein K8F29_09610 [Kofleriaceae bacterium]|nr:hypothetical protein [Candidatus Methylomirabilis lanthanidiphila]